MRGPEAKRRVWVCSECWRASCFRGEFYCEGYRKASAIELTIGDLEKLGLEHSDYWRPGR